MAKNRTIKNIIKKRIVINNKGENIIIKNNKQQLNQPKLISTSNPKAIKIIDPQAKKKNRIEKEKKIPKGLNKHNIRDFTRTGIDITKKKEKKKEIHVPVYYDYPPYIKKKDVDFDVAICISSYNRYSKVKKLLEQIYNQKSNYTYKVFFINDGSSGTIYSRLKKQFSDMIYIENKINGGKINYWKTVTDVWSLVKKYKTHALCQLDDDFIICKNFINIMMDQFFELKKINNGYMALRLHNLVFNDNKFNYINTQGVDGGTLYDINFMKRVNYSVEKTNLVNKNDASNVWVNTTKKIREFGIRVFRFPESLVYHDGNEDSKLNPYIRKIKKMNTVLFIDDK